MAETFVKKVFLKTEGIGKRYRYIWAVRNISLEIGQNSIIGFVGPNGAGKSTLIQLIATTIKPTTGIISVRGSPLTNKTEEFRQNIGFLSYYSFLYDDLTGWENLKFWLNLYKNKPWLGLNLNLEEYILAKAKSFGIEKWLDRPVRELSTGMRKKVDFLRTLLTNPELLLLDEPFSGMDLVNVDFFFSKIKDFRKKMNGTVCIASHNIEFMSKL
ncbi:MAG: ATP-binding cassette domain-containing protein, partial [Candidatus Hodarchaeales archaeon]